jgi:hypothetical protein
VRSKDVQDCFTHMSFFHARLRRLPPPGSELKRLRRDRVDSEALSPP